MREATGIDFSLYRETTVRRRILRRLAILNVDTPDDYSRLLAESAAERSALQRDLLIGVTSFFRDPESFDALKTLVFPAIVANREPKSTIRIWVPGCATGEEAYSILIALEEYQRAARTAYPVQVFASDINDAALDKARAGKYPESIAADVSADRLSGYFGRVDGGYQVSKSLRERCVFSRHNLLDDPPFSKLDLVSCRNVLIYIDSVQRKVIPLFHYALVEGGFLVLGRSETTRHDDLFGAVDPRQRIYVKKSVANRPYESFVHAGTRVRGTDSRGDSVVSRPGRTVVDVSRDADSILIARFSPPGVLVDESLEVLEIRGRPAPFLALSPGKAGLHLLKHVPDTGLFLELERLIRESAATGEVTRQERVSYDADGTSGTLNVEVTPLRNGPTRAFLVLFEPVDAPASRVSKRHAEPRGDGLGRGAQIEKLNRELEIARARLVSLVDERQTADDENQQIAEDALSANEELQSLSEELETAKEELQSTNEELMTVNRELGVRNASLAEALKLARSVVQSVASPLIVVDGDLVVRQINPAFSQAFQLAAAAGEGQPLFEVSAGAWNDPALRAGVDHLLAGQQTFDLSEIQRELPSIGVRVLNVSGVRLEQLNSILLTIEDVTAQRAAEDAVKRSEEQRRQSEKMEAVGRLAGGIAHDFNNLLTVILGNAGLIGDALGRDHPVVEELNEIRQSAERAGALTDQLLSFGRRKVLTPRVFDLNPLVTDFERMLRRLLGERIRIEVRLEAEACLVRADPAEVGRVIMNLCLNARDAMPAGGALTIETSHVVLEEAEAARAGAAAGRYVRLIVSDTGLGMDAETQRHAFEPFFTTKDASAGAGLGLPTVLGILQQTGGAVSVESELGRGTRFTVLLPVALETDAAGERGIVGLTTASKGASEVVLLVEDDDAVRGLSKKILERSGYVVMEAGDGRAGLSLIESRREPIDILVSDVLMPEMSGGELVERALRTRPGLKVLFVSGHAEDVLVREGVTRGVAFLAKPFTPAELVHKVREVLDAPKPPPG